MADGARAKANPAEFLGRKALIGPDDSPLEGIILGIAVYISGSVMIQVAWWDDRQRRCEWFSPALVEILSGPA